MPIPSDHQTGRADCECRACTYVAPQKPEPNARLWHFSSNRQGHMLAVSCDNNAAKRLVVDIYRGRCRIEEYGTGRVLGDWIAESIRPATNDDVRYSGLAGVHTSMAAADICARVRWNFTGVEQFLLRKLREMGRGERRRYDSDGDQPRGGDDDR